MGQLVGTFIGVVVAIAVTLGVFVLLNAVVDLAPKHFRAFATIVGALVGSVVGALANSGGWFLGGPLWPLGGIVLGALLGVLRVGPPAPAARSPLAHHRAAAPGHLPGPAAAVPVRGAGGADDPHHLPELPHGAGRRGRRHENYRNIFGADGPVQPRRRWRHPRPAACSSSALLVAAVGLLAIARCGAPIGGRGIDAGGAHPRDLAHDRRHPRAAGRRRSALRGVIWNNLWWVVVVTGLATLFGLALAVLADRSRGETAAKTLIFMPMAISFVGAAIIWRYVYDHARPARPRSACSTLVWAGSGRPAPQAWIQQTAVEQLLHHGDHDLDPDRVRHGRAVGRHQGRADRAPRGGPRRRRQRGRRCSGGSRCRRSGPTIAVVRDDAHDHRAEDLRPREGHDQRRVRHRRAGQPRCTTSLRNGNFTSARATFAVMMLVLPSCLDDAASTSAASGQGV